MPYLGKPSSMPLALSASINLIRVGYARPPAQWVWWVRAGWGWREFFRLGGSMLAYRDGLAGRAGGAQSTLGADLGNGGFLPFSRGGLGYVARRYVAWPAQGFELKRFLVRRREIANLTTLPAWRSARAGKAGPIGAAGRGGFPLSRSTAEPHAPGVRQIEVQKNLRSKARRIEGDARPRTGRGIQFVQMGSGVRDASPRSDLALEGAESDRKLLGRGYVGKHVPLDAGNSRTLCLARNPVNGRVIV